MLFITVSSRRHKHYVEYLQSEPVLKVSVHLRRLKRYTAAGLALHITAEPKPACGELRYTNAHVTAKPTLHIPAEQTPACAERRYTNARVIAKPTLHIATETTPACSKCRYTNSRVMLNQRSSHAKPTL